MRLFVGEYQPFVNRRVVMGEVVSENPLKIKDVLTAIEIIQQGRNPSWAMLQDPNWTSDEVVDVNMSHFSLTKIVDEISGSEIISQYKKQITEIRAARSGLVMPK